MIVALGVERAKANPECNSIERIRKNKERKKRSFVFLGKMKKKK